MKLDDLAVFNAEVTLALAHVSVNAATLPPLLVSQAAPLLGQSAATGRRGALTGETAFDAVFGARPRSLFDVYQAYWRRFTYRAPPAECRIVVNAPRADSITATPGTNTVTVGYDSRVRCASFELWALPARTTGVYVDDVVIFSDYGLTSAVIDQLRHVIGPGTTVTLLRPGARCFWFGQCDVRHDMTDVMATLQRHIDMTIVFASDPDAPIMCTIFGATRPNLAGGSTGA